METIRFKPDDKHDLRTEFEKIDFRLRFIIMAWSGEMRYKFNYIPMITELLRTSEEQRYIYTVIADEMSRERYRVTPFNSVHQFGRGADFRAYDMTAEMIQFSIDYFKYVPYDISRNIQTLVYHTVGLGVHFHLQVNHEGMLCIRNRPL